MEESIGSYLRRQRNMRQIPLAEVSQATKISMKTLEALEGDDFSKVPGYVFAKGFVKQYAKAIGLDPDETMFHCEQYLRTVLNMDPEKRQKRRWIRKRSFRVRAWVVVVAVMIALTLVGYFLSSY